LRSLTATNPVTAPLGALIQAVIDAIATVVEPPFGPIATFVQSPLDAVTAAIKTLGASIQPGRFRPVGATVQPVVDTLTLVIQARIDTLAPIIQPLVDAIAAAVQPFLDPVALVGHCCSTQHQAADGGNAQNRPVSHGLAPCTVDDLLRHSTQRLAPG
jgi:hypothetical protein